MCFASKQPKATPPPPPVDTTAQDSVQGNAAAQKRAKQAALSAGRSSTLVTGPQGDLSTAPVQKKQVLGY